MFELIQLCVLADCSEHCAYKQNKQMDRINCFTLLYQRLAVPPRDNLMCNYMTFLYNLIQKCCLFLLELWCSSEILLNNILHNAFRPCLCRYFLPAATKCTISLRISYYNHEVSILYVSISVGVVHNCRVLLPISNFLILVIDTQTNRTDCSPVCMCVYIVQTKLFQLLKGLGVGGFEVCKGNSWS